MKKLTAILLIFILFFNVYGYRILIKVLKNNADTRLETRLDNSDYDESRLVEIRVPLNMPYQERFTDFERHYGQIEIEGVSYTYVKRKIEGGTVIFKCIANESRQQLTDFNNHLTLANTGSDTDSPTKQNTSFAKSFFSEYDDQRPFEIPEENADLNAFHSDYTLFVPTHAMTIPDPPPQRISFFS